MESYQNVAVHQEEGCNDNEINEYGDGDDQRSDDFEHNDSNDDDKSTNHGDQSSDDEDDEVETTDDESDDDDDDELTSRNDDAVKGLKDDSAINGNDETDLESSDNEEDGSSSDDSTSDSDDADDENSSRVSTAASCKQRTIAETYYEQNNVFEESREGVPSCDCSTSDSINVQEPIYEQVNEEEGLSCDCLIPNPHSTNPDVVGETTVYETPKEEDENENIVRSDSLNKTFVVKQCKCNGATQNRDSSGKSDHELVTTSDTENCNGITQRTARGSLEKENVEKSGETEHLRRESEEDLNTCDNEEEEAIQKEIPGENTNSSGNSTSVTSTKETLVINESNRSNIISSDLMSNLQPTTLKKEKSKLLDTTPSLERLVDEIDEEYNVGRVSHKNDTLRKTENEFYELEAQILMDYG